jgi:hypothetical protein
MTTHTGEGWHCSACGDERPFIYPDHVQCGTCGHLEPRSRFAGALPEGLGVVRPGATGRKAGALRGARFRPWGAREPVAEGWWDENGVPLLDATALEGLGFVFDRPTGLFFHSEGYVAARPTLRRRGGVPLFEATSALLVAYDEGAARERALALLAIAERMVSVLESGAGAESLDMDEIRETLAGAYPTRNSRSTSAALRGRQGEGSKRRISSKSPL